MSRSFFATNIPHVKRETHRELVECLIGKRKREKIIDNVNRKIFDETILNKSI